MCGRFNVIDNPGLQELLKNLGSDLQLPDRVNVAPTDMVSLVQRGETGANVLTPARWWLTPSWSQGPDQKYAMFNARSEILSKSRAWHVPFKRQRGIVPMSDFIEWRKEGDAKQPYRIQARSGAIAGAALWDVWRSPGEGPALLSCTLVTTAAAESFTPWHHRMPVMLQQLDFERWLDNEQPIAQDDPVFAPRLHEALTVTPIDRAVNRAANRDPQLMEAIGEPAVLDPT